MHVMRLFSVKRSSEKVEHTQRGATQLVQRNNNSNRAAPSSSRRHGGGGWLDHRNILPHVQLHTCSYSFATASIVTSWPVIESTRSMVMQ